MPSDLDVVLDRAPKIFEYRPLPRIKQRLPYRSQLHYEEHIADIRKKQKELRTLVESVLNGTSSEEVQEREGRAAELRERLDKMIVLVKIASKIDAELGFARESLQEALRVGKQTSGIRHRIGWLEERLERLLGKEKPAQVRPQLAILPSPPKEEGTETQEEEAEKEAEEENKEGEEEDDEEEENEEKEVDENDIKMDELEEGEKATEDEVSKDEETREESGETFLTECPDSKSVDIAASEVGSRVAAAAPEFTTDDSMAADEYWSSEHHRVKFADNADVLLDMDPSSYHNLAIVQPGTYISEAEGKDPTLPWRPRRRDSEFEEIHKDALNSLSKRVHLMYSDMHDAAMLSVDPHYKEDVSKGNFLEKIAVKDNDIMDNHDLALPEVRMPKKAGSGAVYYPTPLLAPAKLPIAKLNREKVFPPNPLGYSDSKVDLDPPAGRIVNQGTLYDDTRFTSSLFRRRRGRTQAGRGLESAAEEQRLRDWARESGSPNASSPPGVAPAPLGGSSEASKTTFKKGAIAVRGAQKFTRMGGGNWKNLKPKSGALQHSGLKWERIKEIVHLNLTSTRPLERQDAARTLGLLRCADAMVLFALRKAMMTDEDLQTRYEATKALVLLGCWEEVVLQHIIFFLHRGDPNVRTHLLEAMRKGKNVQFVDKGLPSFPKLAQCLSNLSSSVTEVAFQAATCLGKLCVADLPSKKFLLRFISESSDDDRVAEACETLVRQMNCSEPVVVTKVLDRLRWSPNFRNRSTFARLLVLLGPRVVCAKETDRERVYALLETRVWDDPMKEVRTDIAKAIIALDMFPRTCERAEKKLESPDEDIRGQAVMAIGTLGIRNERIIRTLLEMLELDPSEYIRILVIRTFGAIGLADKRIIRSLQEKEKLEAMFANEARKSLKILLQTPA